MSKAQNYLMLYNCTDIQSQSLLYLIYFAVMRMKYVCKGKGKAVL